MTVQRLVNSKESVWFVFNKGIAHLGRAQNVPKNSHFILPEYDFLEIFAYILMNDPKSKGTEIFSWR